MPGLSVPEAARLLGVSAPRVHQRIADGSLEAERVGHRWVVSAESVRRLQRPATGRALSTRSAWALVATSVTAVGGPSRAALDWAEHYLSTRDRKERSRAAERRAALLADARHGRGDDVATAVAARLRQALGARASRVALRASGDAAALADDPRVTLSGVSTPASGLDGGGLVELYVDAPVLDRLVADHGLTTSGDPGVVLHVLDRHAALDPPSTVLTTPLVLAADLAEHGGRTEERRALEVLAGLAGLAGDGS